MAKNGKTTEDEQTAEQLAKIAADRAATLIKTDADGVTRYKCQYCGKWIKADSFEEFMAGDYCHHLRDELGWTSEMLAEHRKSMSSNDVPLADDGRPYVKVAVLGRICEREGIPVSRLVKAFGRDRTIDGAMHPKFTPVYVGKARYVHPDCAEKWGMDFMRNLDGGRSGKPTEQSAVEAALS